LGQVQPFLFFHDIYIMSDDTIFNKNKDVFTSLTKYNDAYKNYKLCLDSGETCDDSLMNNYYNHLTREIKSLIAMIEARPPSKNQDIKKRIDENNNLRRDLESKLQDIYQYKNPGMSEFPVDFSGIHGRLNETNLSLHSGILWTILATSCLYYILVKF